MPKHHMYQEPSEDGRQDISRRLELHWARETRIVMLGSTRWQGQPDKIATDREFLDADNSNGSPLPAWDGPLVTLDRSGINHLIKQLRMARDQAFGKDE